MPQDWVAGTTEYDRERAIKELMLTVDIPLRLVIDMLALNPTDVEAWASNQSIVLKRWAELRRAAAESLYDEMQKDKSK